MTKYIYNVYLKSKIIDHIYFTTIQDKELLRKSLVTHDNYDENIVVKRKRIVK